MTDMGRVWFMAARLNQKQIVDIRREFYMYKSNRKLTTKQIARKLGVGKNSVQFYFKKFFGKEYEELARQKSAWSTKVDKTQVIEAFDKYKEGALISLLEKDLGLKRGALLPRFRKILGKKYIELAKDRKYRDAGISRKNRTSDEVIKKTFEKYKKNRVPIEKLAKSIGLQESSLVDRFKRLFGDEYKKIAYSRRDERKVSKKEYELAFERYKNTNISLTELSEDLNVQISSLAPRFARMYGNAYRKIARQKQDLIEIDKKGRIAEELAIEYLQLIGLKIEDVRKKCVIKNSLKRPDFIIGDTFIEVKNNYVTMDGFGNVKGYKKILNDYIGKIVTNGHETILKNGIIISFSGFSPSVRKQALSDRTALIGPKEIEETFRNNNRLDLINKLNGLRGLF